MRFVRLALLTSVLTAGPAVAQTTGGNLGAASAATGTLGSSTSSTTTSSSTASSGGATTNTTNTTTAAPVISGATITGTTSAATSSGGGVDRSNFLGATYSNPYYQGLYSNSTGAPGQFGTALYGTTGGSASTTTGTRSASGNTTRTTTAGGANPLGTSASQTGGRAAGGGQFQGGGLGGASSQFGGQIVPLPRNIAYSAVLRFPAPAVAPAQRLADVQAVLARSSMMANPAGVTVVQDGTAFVLRGAVASEDEARLAEGMVRLTPGVRDVRNELTFPKE